MITFQKIEISNFKSIKSASLEYSSGVWEVVGVNNDTPFSSNGSGKTTILEAIQQCLFNKTTASPPIEDANRKTVGSSSHQLPGYKLEVTFEKDDKQYRVVNSREAMRIQIFVDGEDLLIKSIPNVLKRIVEIIGMDFNTFITLTFISHDTIVELLDNFSSSSLMKIILNFSQITDFEKSAKLEQKRLAMLLSSQTAQLQTVKDSLTMLSQFVEIDTEPLLDTKVRTLRSLKDLDETVLTAVEEKEGKVSELQSSLEEKKEEHSTLVHKYNDSRCKCCGQLVELTVEARDKLLGRINCLEDEITKVELEVSGATLLARNHREIYDREYKKLQVELDNINKSITIANTKNQMYESNKNHTESLRKQVADLDAEVTNTNFRTTVIQTALLVLKSGDIQKTLLGTFVAVLNLHLQNFIKFVSLDYITIMSEATKASVSFKLFDSRFNHNISIHTLSGGEKTRLRLVVLLAMLQTVKEITDTSTNILVFDESLDTLDISATKDLANLFDYLVHHDNKFIALVSHGDQLQDIKFSGKIIAEKSSGITSITKESHV